MTHKTRLYIQIIKTFHKNKQWMHIQLNDQKWLFSNNINIVFYTYHELLFDYGDTDAHILIAIVWLSHNNKYNLFTVSYIYYLTNTFEWTW